MNDSASEPAARPVANVYFLDVAQGTSQVIQVGSNLVIIDCGKSSAPVLSLLSSLAFDRISAIVISHWHDDHVGGLIGILKQFPSKIDVVHFPQTWPAEDLLHCDCFDEFIQFMDSQESIRADRLVAKGVNPSVHRATIDGCSVELACIFPAFLNSIRLQLNNDHNAGSGVLFLECGAHKILFPGDVGRIGLEAIKKEFAGGSVLNCLVCAAPHHSGGLGRDANYDGYESPYDWLYTEIILPKYLVVSVGTNNSYNHPNQRHIDAARRRKVKVMCTQITRACASDTDRLRPSLLPNCLPSSSCQMGGGIGCAGTVHFELFSDKYEVKRWAEHQAAITELEKVGSPLCRPILT